MIRAFVCFLALLVLAAPVSAQDKPAAGNPPLLMLTQYPPTHPERIVMAFHKIANMAPDFLSWGKQSPFLKDAKGVDQDAIISRETNRLQRAWSEFDLNDPLVVHTLIHLDNYSSIQEMLYISEFTPKTFFSYALYGENIAIVPKGIAGFSKISITKEQMDDILKKAGGGQVTAELLLKPVVADAKTPFVQNDTSYWLLLAEIGEIRFWSDRGGEPQLLWMNRADWFKPKDDKALMDLKGGL